jgi:hypothetical protein
MSTYRERREAKAERLREWADKRDDKAQAAADAGQQTADMIPFGQPILVGHHSEKGDRNRRDRMRRNFDKAREHGDKAADFRRRADGIEAAADRAVYSDDVDAVERLTVRIAEREGERDRIKAFNANVRATGTADLELLDAKQQASYLSVVAHSPYQLGKGGQFPGYVLSNLGATIRKDKKRLAALGG